MQPREIVSHEEWLVARKAHLAKEKEFTRARDKLSAERRTLPWVKVEKAYAFDALDGKKTLADLFDGHSQLLVYHFMLGPSWKAGCPSCSLKDKYGLSWQIIPTVLLQMMINPDPKKSERVMKAFLSMKKFDIAALERAYEGA